MTIPATAKEPVLGGNAGMSSEYLEVRDLQVSFDGFKAVDGVDLTLMQGDLRFLIGPNGAGKTTLVDAITGLVPATGSVTKSGVELIGKKVHRIARLGVGRTFQTASVFEELTVLQNLDIAAGAGRSALTLLRRRKTVLPAIEEALDVTGLGKLRDTPAGILAHGQKQWLEIGMLLVQNCSVLLLDEPVAGMSHEERDETGNLLRRIGGERTVVVVEHDMDFMRAFATSVTVLHAGKVLSEGTVEQVQADPRVQEVYLGTAAAGAAPELQPEVLRRTAMLELDDIRAGYGRTEVIHGVALTVPSDGVAAVMGHNGAGKTTLLRAAVGLIKVDTGRVLFDGEDVTALRPSARVARGLAYVPQGQQSFGQLTTAENLQVVADGRKRGKELVGEVLDLFPALRGLLDRRAGLLSGGQRQQLAIARALITEPKMLILDEPTEGIQPSVVAEIERTIVELTRRGGLGVLLVEQHIGFALESAESYYVLESGRVTSSGAGGAAPDTDVRTAVSDVRAAMAI